MDIFPIPVKFSGLNYKTKYLLPGDVYISKTPTIVKTVLGSCISVVFYCKRLKLGGISHAQLPKRRDSKCDTHCYDNCAVLCMQYSPDENDLKYVSCSTNFLYDQFCKEGAKPDEITVKLFGGSRVLKISSENYPVGLENIKTAKQVIKKMGLKIKSKKYGEETGMSLLFLSDTGKVFVKPQGKINEK